MLIQNSSNAATASGLASDSAPVAVAASQARPAPVERPQAAPEQTPPPNTAQLQSAVDNINRAMKQSNANVEFSIDSDTKQTVIRVVESGTGQVIRQFPSEDVLAISRAIDQMQQHGLLLQQEA